MQLLISDLRLDPDLQPRVSGLDSGHVSQLEQNPDAWPPIAVVMADGKYLLVDGFHRLAAAQNLCHTEMEADLLAAPYDGDFRGLAFKLNAAHGRPLTLPDRKAEAARRLKVNPAVSNMEVASTTALSPSTVQAIREQLEAQAAIERVPQRVSASGATYTPIPPGRATGELPGENFGDLLAKTVGVAVTSAERQAQRKIARYLMRLSVALNDMYELDGWSDGGAAAGACVAVLGRERAVKLGEELGEPTRYVLAVVQRLAPASGLETAP